VKRLKELITDDSGRYSLSALIHLMVAIVACAEIIISEINRDLSDTEFMYFLLFGMGTKALKMVLQYKFGIKNADDTAK